MQFIIKFRCVCRDYKSNLQNLKKLTQTPNNEAEIISIIKNVKPFLFQSICQDDQLSEHFQLFAQIALYLKNKDWADLLLNPFSISSINVDSVHFLYQLQTLYDTKFCLDFFDHLKNEKKQYVLQNRSNLNLVLLVQSLIENKIDQSLVLKICDYYASSFIQHNKSNYHFLSPKYKKEKTTFYMKILIENILAFYLANEEQSFSKIIFHVLENLKHDNEIESQLELSELIIKIHHQNDIKNKNSFIQTTFEMLKESIFKNTKEEFEEGLRENNDVSILASPKCRCAHCQPVLNFLNSKTEFKKSWALKQEYRDHIEANFYNLLLPVEFNTLTKSRPYQLEIVKNTQKIYQQAKTRFEKIASIYERLNNLN